MKEQDILRLLDGVDESMLEEAETYGRQRKTPRKSYWKYALMAAGFIAAFGMGYFSGMEKVNNQNNSSNYALAKNTQSVTGILGAGSMEDGQQENEAEDASIEPNTMITVMGSNEEYLVTYNPDTKVVSLNKNKVTEYNRLCTGAVKNHWLDLKNVFEEVDMLVESGEIPDEEIYYLVELDVLTLSEDYKPYNFDHTYYYFHNEEALREEYERFNTEYGYEFKWLAPGAYQIPNSYVYCQIYGRMYGLLTREQIINLPVNEEYGYTFNLVTTSILEMAEWEYSETYTEAELQISQWQAMRSFK